MFRRATTAYCWILAGLIHLSFALGLSSAQADSYDPQHPIVLDMVKRGLGYLTGGKSQSDGYSHGSDMLAAMAIFKADAEIPLDSPRIAKGVNSALDAARRLGSNNYHWAHDSMYSVPVAGMLLCTIDAVQYGTEIKYIRDALLATQRPHGGFGYMNEGAQKERGQGDISQTQYVMLCFWTMSQSGIEIPKEPVVRCMNFLMTAQQPTGGWGYQFPNPGENEGNATNSRTAAGFSAYLVAGDTLGIFRSKWAENQEDEGIVPTAFKRVDPNAKPARVQEIDRGQVDSVIKKGLTWFEGNPYHRATWHYYFVYSKERYESFLEVTRGKKTKSPPWYNEGVEALMAAQNVDGSWGTKAGDADGSLGPELCTSFAILFLIRSTQKAIGEMHDDVLLGGQGLPDDPTAVVVKNGKIISRTTATSIDEALKMLEDDSNSEGKDSLIPDQLNLPKDPKERSEQLNRFARLMNSRDAATRRFSARLLGRGDDLEYVPALVYGLSDPDASVARLSEASLRLISRQLDTYHLPREGAVDQNHRNNAILKWRQWYLTVRPDFVFVD